MSHSTRKPVPKFLSKLYTLTNTEDDLHMKCISWATDGKSFYVSAIDTFASHLLPLYYSHNNYSSFVRQLNLYQFRRSTENKGKVVPGMSMVEHFRHDKFHKGRMDLLPEVRRQAVSKRVRGKKSEDDTVPRHKFEAAKNKAETVQAELREAERATEDLHNQNLSLAKQLEQAQQVLQALHELASTSGVAVSGVLAEQVAAVLTPGSSSSNNSNSSSSSASSSHGPGGRKQSRRRSTSLPSKISATPNTATAAATAAAAAAAATVLDASGGYDDDSSSSSDGNSSTGDETERITSLPINAELSTIIPFGAAMESQQHFQSTASNMFNPMQAFGMPAFSTAPSSSLFPLEFTNSDMIAPIHSHMHSHHMNLPSWFT